MKTLWYGTYCRLNVHVGASNRAVIKAASRRIVKAARFSRKDRAARHAFYRDLLTHHRDARALVRRFRL
jgi:hypothetical protein